VKLQWLGYLGVALACCLPTRSVEAQEKTDRCERPVTSSAYATLRLTLQGGQSVYREGEIIPLELTFTSSLVHFIHKKGDAFGFLCLSPDGHDPLQDDEESGLWGNAAISGNSGPYLAIGNGLPYSVSEELNESKSVSPGSYSLRVRAFGPASNEIKFQVFPATPEWQAEQLASALAVLDAEDAKESQANVERTNHAIRVLRFLGSEASTRELARRFWFHDRQQPSRILRAEYPISPYFYGYERSQKYWDFKAGLIASPYRAVAIQELTAAIHDPQHPPTRAMIETLALLEIQSTPEFPRFIPRSQYQRVELQSPTPECPFLFLPCASHPSKLELQRQAKGAAYNALLAEILKRSQ
jgi:hypothetical protein